MAIKTAEIAADSVDVARAVSDAADPAGNPLLLRLLGWVGGGRWPLVEEKVLDDADTRVGVGVGAVPCALCRLCVHLLRLTYVRTYVQKKKRKIMSEKNVRKRRETKMGRKNVQKMEVTP